MRDGGVSWARGHWVGDRSSTVCHYGGPLTRGPAQASNKQSHLGSQMLGQCPIPLWFVLEELNYKCRALTKDCSSCKYTKVASKSKSSALIMVSLVMSFSGSIIMSRIKGLLKGYCSSLLT